MNLVNVSRLTACCLMLILLSLHGCSKEPGGKTKANRSTTVPDITGSFTATAYDSQGAILYVADANAGQILKIKIDKSEPANSQTLSRLNLGDEAPRSLALDSHKNLILLQNTSVTFYNTTNNFTEIAALTANNGESYTSMAYFAELNGTSSLFLGVKNYETGGGQIIRYDITDPANVAGGSPVELTDKHGLIVGANAVAKRLFTASLNHVKRRVSDWDLANNKETDLNYPFGKSYSEAGRLYLNEHTGDVYVVTEEGDTAYNGTVPVYRNGKSTDQTVLTLPYQPSALTFNQSSLILGHTQTVINPTQERSHAPGINDIHVFDAKQLHNKPITQTVTGDYDKIQALELLDDNLLLIVGRKNNLDKFELYVQ